MLPLRYTFLSKNYSKKESNDYSEKLQKLLKRGKSRSLESSEFCHCGSCRCRRKALAQASDAVRSSPKTACRTSFSPLRACALSLSHA